MVMSFMHGPNFVTTGVYLVTVWTHWRDEIVLALQITPLTRAPLS